MLGAENGAVPDAWQDMGIRARSERFDWSRAASLTAEQLYAA